MTTSEHVPTDEDLGPVLRAEALPGGDPFPALPCTSCGNQTFWADGVCTRCTVVAGRAAK